MPETIPLFDDAGYTITIADDESDPDEPRFVVYSGRGDNIRTISARPAETHERDHYEAER